MHKLMLLCTLLFVLLFSTAKATDKLSGHIAGKVIDAQTKEPLVGVNVTIPAIKHGASTNERGEYTIINIDEGAYVIKFSLLGYASETRSIVVESEEFILNVSMKQSSLQIPTVSITGNPQAANVLLSPQSTSVVEGREFESERGQTIVQTLANLPGISCLSTGGAIAKPVIRGLTSQRVVVVNDGVRQEGQQWGDEHGPEIDVLQADKIEVVRGPGSVLYGSDAIGGVVNVISPDLMTTDEGKTILQSKLSLNGFTNNNQFNGGFVLDGATGKLGYRGALSLQNASDIKTPNGNLFNSGFQELNGNGAFGYHSDAGLFNLAYSHFGSKLKMHEDPAEDPTATPFQRVIHDKINFHSIFNVESFRLEMQGGWQKNWRREFEEAIATEPGLELVTNTYTLDVHAHHRPVGSLFGTIGFSFLQQNLVSLREEKLIPDSKTNNIGAFLFEEYHYKEMEFSAGLRFDTRKLDVDYSNDLNITAQARNYNALSGSLGATWRPVENIVFATNISEGWRAPASFELFAHGVHEGTAAYEIGNSALIPERSTNIDISTRYVSADAIAEITFFSNSISNYIYRSPTGLIDSASTFPIYFLKQTNAQLFGGEFSLKSELASWCVVNVGVDFVRAENKATNNPLPFIPPSKIVLGIRFQQENIGSLKRPYIGFKTKIVQSQERIDPLETRTGGYSLYGISSGFDIPTGKNILTLDFGIENIFDKAYVDHLSRYKLYALNPGRNMILKISMPFQII